MSRAGRIALIGLGLGLAACKPEYPKCETDEHCAEKNEYCVNQQCQECRTDQHCIDKNDGERWECISGRCEQYECKLDADCEGGLVCRSKKCVPECTEDADCPSGDVCEEQRCVDECSEDIDCGPGMMCDQGECVEEKDATEISSECRPMDPASDQVVALERVLFDFNEYDLTSDAQSKLDQNADCLQQASIEVIIEGHADERGTQEYNLALGEKRANAVRDYLRNLGIDTTRLRTRSKGENEPVCYEKNESCYSRNRRVEFIQRRSGGM